MEIFFAEEKLARTLNVEAQLTRAFDAATGRQVRLRLAVLAACVSLADVPVRPPDGRHQFAMSPTHQFAVYAGARHRIVFEPRPSRSKSADGRLDLHKVRAITILDIVQA